MEKVAKECGFDEYDYFGNYLITYNNYFINMNSNFIHVYKLLSLFSINRNIYNDIKFFLSN